MGLSFSKQKLIEYMTKEDITHLLKYTSNRSLDINEHSLKFSCDCRGIHTSEAFALIHYAASNCSAKILLLLENDGANVNEQTSESGYTPLMLAAMHNNPENVYTLCYFMKCEKNTKDTSYEENTALHIACKYGCKEIVEKLLALGADPMVLNKHGKTPKDVAVYLGHREIAKLFKPEATVKRKSSNITNTLLLNEINHVKEELKVISQRTSQRESLTNEHQSIDTVFEDAEEDVNSNRRKARSSESCRNETSVKRSLVNLDNQSNESERKQANISFSNDDFSRTKPKSRLSSSKDGLETGSVPDVSTMKGEESLPYIDDVDEPMLTSSPVAKKDPNNIHTNDDITEGDSAVDVADEVISELHHFQIKDNYEELIRMMKPDLMVTKFYTIGDFDDDDRDHLHSVTKKTEKNKYILKAIQNGSEKMFHNFITFLEGTNQRTLAKIIQQTKGPVPKSCKRTFNERRSQSELNLPSFSRTKGEDYV